MRYRGRYLLDALQAAHGVQATMIFPGYGWANVLFFIRFYLKVLLFRPRGSWIVIQKLYTRGIYARALRWLVRLRPQDTIYDLDDAEYLRHSPETLHFFLKHCSRVVVGSRELERYALQFNKAVHCIGSPIIAQPAFPLTDNPILHLGWIGFYNNHRVSIEELVFPALDQATTPLQLTLLGVDRPAQREAILARFQGHLFVQIDLPDAIDWQDEAGIYQRIAQWDLGLAPLLDTEFNRAKSAFKLKQCLAAGVPVAASPVGENLAVMRDGAHGFFFEDAGELLQKLAHFSQLSPAAQATMRQRCRQDAEQHAVEGYARRFLEVNAGR